ncbi:unnamed protein product [Enterobius vermicularis]|uniref:Uncharacterized protein n=1 Tax=Enterobius vermicularis TaxID=51028 RepID=A0A0N4V269_ENTVE|nr:unnamed protein product [Enterobius vermicularis]
MNSIPRLPDISTQIKVLPFKRQPIKSLGAKELAEKIRQANEEVFAWTFAVDFSEISSQAVTKGKRADVVIECVYTDSEIDEEDEDDDKKNVSSQLRSSPQYSRQKR